MTAKKPVEGLTPINASVPRRSEDAVETSTTSSTALERFIAWEPSQPATSAGLSGLSLEEVKEIQPLLMELLTSQNVAPAQIAQAGKTPIGTAEYEIEILKAQLEAAERATLFPVEAKAKIAKIQGELQLLEAQQESRVDKARLEAAAGAETAEARLSSQRLVQQDEGKQLEHDLRKKDVGREIDAEREVVNTRRERVKVSGESLHVDVEAEKQRLDAEILVPAELQKHRTKARQQAVQNLLDPYRRFIAAGAVLIVAVTVYANITVDGGRSVPVLNQVNLLWDWFWQPVMDYIMRR